jgi:hypothetical protein
VVAQLVHHATARFVHTLDGFLPLFPNNGVVFSGPRERFPGLCPRLTLLVTGLAPAIYFTANHVSNRNSPDLLKPD